jgi:hypothetical protein
MKITVQESSLGIGPSVVGTCPHCGHIATFGGLPSQDLAVLNAVNRITYFLGHRVCPNPMCRGHIFFVAEGNNVVQFYPPARIGFTSTNVPSSVADSLNEAIDCHSNKSYRAAAVMIRRSIDHICKNKGAQGNDLKARIEALKDKVILPPSLFAGMQNLRMLGNDGAHTDAKVFDEIGEKEISAGIEFAKKVTEAVYQYGDLLSKLENLKSK